METDFRGMPLVRICAACQQAGQPANSHFALGADNQVKDELKVVNSQVKNNRDKFSFSHGICQPHMIQSLQQIPGMTKERIQSMIDKSNKGNPVPCLLTNEPIRHAYMKGLFTQEQIQQAANSQQQAQQSLKEHFRKLAGIKS